MKRPYFPCSRWRKMAEVKRLRWYKNHWRYLAKKVRVCEDMKLETSRGSEWFKWHLLQFELEERMVSIKITLGGF